MPAPLSFDDVLTEGLASPETQAPVAPPPPPPQIHPDLKFDDVISDGLKLSAAPPERRTPSVVTPPTVPVTGAAALTPQRAAFSPTTLARGELAVQRGAALQEPQPPHVVPEWTPDSLQTGSAWTAVQGLQNVGEAFRDPTQMPTVIKETGRQLGRFGAKAVIPVLRAVGQKVVEGVGSYGMFGETDEGETRPIIDPLIEKLKQPTETEKWWAQEEEDTFTKAMKEQGVTAAVSAKIASDVFTAFGSTALILAGAGGGGGGVAAASKMAKAKQLAGEAAKFAALTWVTTPGDDATRTKAAAHAAALVGIPGAASFIPSALIAKVAAAAALTGLSIPAYQDAIMEANRLDQQNGKGFWPNFTATATGMTLMNLVFAAATPSTQAKKPLTPSETPSQPPAVAPESPTAGETAPVGVLTRPPRPEAIEGAAKGVNAKLRPVLPPETEAVTAKPSPSEPVVQPVAEPVAAPIATSRAEMPKSAIQPILDNLDSMTRAFAEMNRQTEERIASSGIDLSSPPLKKTDVREGESVFDHKGRVWTVGKGKQMIPSFSQPGIMGVQREIIAGKPYPFKDAVKYDWGWSADVATWRRGSLKPLPSPEASAETARSNVTPESTGVPAGRGGTGEVATSGVEKRGAILPAETKVSPVVKTIKLGDTFADPEAANELVESVKNMGQTNPINEKQVVIDGVKVEVERQGGRVNLKEISATTIGQGKGSKVLDAILTSAEHAGVDIVVSPEKIGATPKNRLIEWYRRHGFEEYTQGRMIYRSGKNENSTGLLPTPPVQGALEEIGDSVPERPSTPPSPATKSTEAVRPAPVTPPEPDIKPLKTLAPEAKPPAKKKLTKTEKLLAREEEKKAAIQEQKKELKSAAVTESPVVEKKKLEKKAEAVLIPEERLAKIKATPIAQRDPAEVEWANNYSREQIKAEQAAKPEAEKVAKDRLALTRYTSEMPQLERGKTLAVLDKPRSINGKTDTQAKYVERSVAAGARVVTRKNGRRSLEHTDGRFMYESDLSKVALDYAEHLIANESSYTREGDRYVFKGKEEAAKPEAKPPVAEKAPPAEEAKKQEPAAPASKRLEKTTNVSTLDYSNWTDKRRINARSPAGHRKIARIFAAFKDRGIPIEATGSFTLNSKSQMLIIPDTQEARELLKQYGGSVAKEQWEWLNRDVIEPTSITSPAPVKVTTDAQGDKTISVPSKDKPGLPPKEQKKYLLAEIDKAIEGASDLTPTPTMQEGRFETEAVMQRRLNDNVRIAAENKAKIGTITIEVPNDGTFEILNSKEALRTFKKQAAKFPVSTTSPDVTRTTTAKPLAVPTVPTKRPSSVTDLKAIIEPMASKDGTRGPIEDVHIDGESKAVIATDGRRLAVILDAPFKTTEHDKGTYPDWKQPIPGGGGKDMPKTGYDSNAEVDTLDLARKLNQAIAVTKGTPTDRVTLYRTPDGKVELATTATDVGGYESADISTAKPIGNYNAEFLRDAMTFFRKMGNESVRLEWQDALSPIVFLGKREYYVLMPMKGEGSRLRPVTTRIKQRLEPKKKAESQPRPGPSNVGVGAAAATGRLEPRNVSKGEPAHERANVHANTFPEWQQRYGETRARWQGRIETLGRGDPRFVQPINEAAATGRTEGVTPEGGGAKKGINAEPRQREPTKTEDVGVGSAAGSGVRSGAPMEFPAGSGTKNAYTEEMQKRLGWERSDPSERQSDQQALDLAITEIARNPGYGSELVTRMDDAPFVPTAVERMALLHETVVREQASQNGRARVNELIGKADRATLDAAKKQSADADAALRKIYDAVQSGSREWGRAGKAMQRMMAEDYSLTRLEQQFKVANEREPNEVERSELKMMADEYAAKEKAYQDYIAKKQAELDAKNEALSEAKAEADFAALLREVMPKEGAKPRKFKKAALDLADAWEADYDAYMKSAAGRVSALVDPMRVVVMAKMGAAHIIRGSVAFAEWAGKMRGSFKDTTDEELKAIYEKSRRLAEVAGRRDDVAERAKREPKPVEPSAEREPGEGGEPLTIKELFRAQAEAGVRDVKTAVKNVTEILRADDSTLTERDVRDQYSDYGKSRRPSQEEIDVQLRDWRAQSQKLSQLEDALSGKAPKRTGTQRDEPSQTVRELTKQVHDAMKKMGIVVGDPARRLKSALDSVKTRLENQIEDLTKALTNQQKMLKTKTGVEYDAKAKELLARRNELQKQYDEMFPREPTVLTDAQRLNLAIRAAERNAEVWQERLERAKKGDFTPPAKPSRLMSTNERLEAARGNVEAAKAEVQRLKDIANPPLTEEQQAIKEYKARLMRMIAAGEKRIASSDFAKKEKKELDISSDPVAMRLAADYAETKINIAKAREQWRWNNLEPWQKRAEIATEVYDMARNIAYSADDSFLGRQGWFFMMTHPVKWLKAGGKSLKAFRTEDSQRYGQQFVEKENYRNGIYKAMKLELNKPDSTGNYSGADDMFGLNLTREVPGIGRIVDASGRSFATAANDIRGTFADILLQNTRMGREIMRNPKHLTKDQRKFLEDIGWGINALSGRGHMAHAEGASRVFGAPRFLKAIFDTVIHRPIWHPNSTEAKMAFAKEYLKVYAILASLYILPTLFLKDDKKRINWAHPTASDWGAIPLANGQTMNPLAPAAAVLRVLSRIFSGQKITPKGTVNLRSSWLPLATEEERGKKVPYGQGQWNDIGQFLRQKAHPGINAAMGMVTGEDFSGQPASRIKLLLQGFTPISPWQAYEAAKISGIPTATATSALEFFGISAKPDYNSPEYKAYEATQKAAVKRLTPSTSRLATPSTTINQ